MAEKRTRAAKLQLNIERLERHDDARQESELSGSVPDLLSAATDPIPTEARVRERAYELFEARGREHGHDREDWLQAEAEIFALRPTDSSRVAAA